MSIAFPAFFIFLLVLPGILYRYAYLRGLSINNPFVITSMADEICYGVVGAAIFHAVWCAAFQFFHHPIDYGAVLILLVGSYGEHQEYLRAAISTICANTGLVAFYFLSIYIGAALVGILVHEAVRTLKLDHRFALLRFRNEWYYLLSGEYAELPEQRELVETQRPNAVFLSTVVTHGGVNYLYRGFVIEHYFDRTGNLDRVVLCDAMRRRLDDDRPLGTEHRVEGDERFYSIVGDRFVIKYSEMQTINIQGISVAES